MQNALLTIITAASILIGAYSYWRNKKLAKSVRESEEELNRRMYELSILKELGDRTGYSLNIQKIIDVITGSLSQLVDYSAVSYALLRPGNIAFKANLKEPVSREFIEDVKKRMIASLSALLDKNLSVLPIDETVIGAVGEEVDPKPVNSFFNIPLVIGGNVLGVLTVAHTKSGLYEEKEMTILYKIVNQASQAVTRLEEVVKTEEGKLNAMVESMNDGILMTDKDYRVAVINPAAKTIADVPHKKEVTIFDFIDHLEGKLDIRGKLEESITFGKTFVVDDVVLPSGIFQIHVSPVKNTGGDSSETVGGVVIFHDVTRERQAEKLREHFTSMIVHELRSPLGNMKKIGEIMKIDTTRQDKKVYDEYVGMFYESASEMLDIVNDLLDVAKLDAGKFEVSKRPSNIVEIIDDNVHLFDTTARDAKIELVKVFSGNLPEQAPFDALRISQVLANLISNALKFSSAGGKVFIQALVHAKGNDIEKEAEGAGITWFKDTEKKIPDDYDNALVIAVTDTGEGISIENKKKLFNKFEQFGVGARSGKPKGTGLGLVVVKGIIETHGGLVGVVSEEGVGSTFYFTIKL